MLNSLQSRHSLTYYAQYTFCIWTALLVINGAPGQAQQRAQNAAVAKADKPARPVLPQPVQAILDDLQNVPPELHADALLLLVESGEKLDRPTKIKFLHEAVEEAVQASVPVKMISGVLLLGRDSAEDLESRDDDRNLDQVSLLSRAVIDMATLDPAEAWKLADSIRLPDLPPVECSDPLAYDPRPWYAALEAVSQHTNPSANRARPSQLDLLTPAVSQLETDTQVVPALQLLSEPGLSVQEREVLTGLFLDALSRRNGDPRDFTAEMLHAYPAEAAMKLYQVLEAADPGSGLALLRQFRAYLVSNYSAGGCGELWDSLNIIGVGKGSSLLARIEHARTSRLVPGAVKRFNEDFHDALDSAGLAPIQFSEIDGADPGPKATIHEYGGAGLLAIEKAQQHLRFDQQDEYQTEATRSSSAWRAEAIDYLDSIDDWQGDSSDPLETAHEKSESYTALLDLAPEQDLRWLALTKDLSMIENSGLENQNPSAWMELMLEIQWKIPYNGPAHEKKIASPGFLTRLLQSPSPSVRLIGLLYSLGIDPFSSGPLPK
jgi:hypothetical protein